MVLELYRMESNVTEEKEAEQTTRFNTNRLAGGFNMTDKALACFGSLDPNIQSFATVVAVAHSAVDCYMLIYREMKTATVKTFLPYWWLLTGNRHQKEKACTSTEHGAPAVSTGVNLIVTTDWLKNRTLQPNWSACQGVSVFQYTPVIFILPTLHVHLIHPPSTLPNLSILHHP